MNCQRMSSSAERQLKSCIGKLRVIWKSLWRKPWKRMLGRLKAISTQTLYTTWKLTIADMLINCQLACRVSYYSLQIHFNTNVWTVFRLGGSPLYHQGQKSDCLNCAEFTNCLFEKKLQVQPSCVVSQATIFTHTASTCRPGKKSMFGTICETSEWQL